MTLSLPRRGLLGLLAAGLAPGIIRTPGLLMPIKPNLLSDEWEIEGIPWLKIGDVVTISGIAGKRIVTWVEKGEFGGTLWKVTRRV